MTNPQNDPLEPLVRAYLLARLDGQLGKAEARFAALAPDSAEAVPARRPAPRRGRLFAAVAATAASITAAVWCGFQVGRQPGPEKMSAENQAVSEPVEPTSVAKDEKLASDPGQNIAPGEGLPSGREASTPEPVLVGQQLQWHTIDEGIVYLDPQTPVRKLRRQRLERVQWYDAARGAHVQMVVPREEVQYVALSSS